MTVKIKTPQHAILVLRQLRVPVSTVYAQTGVSPSSQANIANGLIRRKSQESDRKLVEYAEQFVPKLKKADFMKILYLVEG